jgi:hypothetical protein
MSPKPILGLPNLETDLGSPRSDMGLLFWCFFFSVTHKIGLFSPKLETIWIALRHPPSRHRRHRQLRCPLRLCHRCCCCLRSLQSSSSPSPVTPSPVAPPQSSFSSLPVAIVAVVVSCCAVARRVVAIIILESIRGHPILVWGPPYRFGDPQTKTGIPGPIWGCESQRIPKPIRGSLNQSGDQYIPIPKRGSQNRFGDCSVTNQNRFGVRSNLGL